MQMDAQPRILVINDDDRLLNTRRMLLEQAGAYVIAARGIQEAVKDALTKQVDLVLIDATNVGLEHAQILSEFVKTVHPRQCVALLVAPEAGTPAQTKVDRVILRRGPRRLLTEINELIGGRFDLNFWEGQGRYEDADSPSSAQE